MPVIERGRCAEGGLLLTFARASPLRPTATVIIRSLFGVAPIRERHAARLSIRNPRPFLRPVKKCARGFYHRAKCGSSR